MPTSTIHISVVKKHAFQLILFHAHSCVSHNLFKRHSGSQRIYCHYKACTHTSTLFLQKRMDKKMCLFQLTHQNNNQENTKLFSNNQQNNIKSKVKQQNKLYPNVAMNKGSLPSVVLLVRGVGRGRLDTNINLPLLPKVAKSLACTKHIART